MSDAVTVDELIDAATVGVILGWPMDRVYRMTREKRIPVARRVGHVYLYSEPAIRGFKQRLELEAEQVRRDEQLQRKGQ